MRLFRVPRGMAWALASRAIALALLGGDLLGEEAPSLDKLVEQLEAREVPIRRNAAAELAKKGAAAKAALPALIKALNDPDKQVWSSAIGAIASLGPDAAEAVPTLLENLDSRKNRGGRDRDRRQLLMRSAYALSRIGAAAKTPLLESLKSEDGMARAGAARALGGLVAAASEAVPGLVANLRRDQPDERRETIDALGQIGPEAAPALAEALASGESLVRSGAALALAQISPLPNLVSAKIADATARETDPTVRAALFSAIPKAGLEPARAVELLIAGVKDDNEAVRHGAINAIYFLRSANAALVPALNKLLRDPNPALSERAAVVVGRLGATASETVPVLLEVTRQRTPTPPVYFDALGQIGPAAVPGVLHAIEKENPDTLTRDHWSVKCLQTIGGEAVTPLSKALTDASVSIRLIAARALGELGPVATPAFRDLLGAVSDTDPRMRATALGALVSTRQQPVAAAARVETALKDSSPIVRVAAAELVPYLGAQARPLAPALLGALEDRDATVRSAVVQALAAVGSAAEPAIGTLVKMLASADAPTRVKVLAVFASIGPTAKTTLPGVRQSLADPDATVRAAAIAAFTKIEQPENRLPALLVALDDSALPVRKAAAQGLAILSTRAQPATGKLTALLQREEDRDAAFDALRQLSVTSVPDLVTMLSDRDLTVRIFAAQRLGRLGADARPAIPPLEAILASNDRSDLKQTVTEALKRIRP